MSDFSGNPEVFHSSISANRQHGVFSDETGSFRLVGCRLEDNTGGGVVTTPDSGGRLVNCVISTNGDGVYIMADSGVSLRNCTVADNLGDGIGIQFGSEGGCRLSNCIVWNDTLSRLDVPEQILEAFEVSHSITEGPVLFPGEGNSNADPLFVSVERTAHRGRPSRRGAARGKDFHRRRSSAQP